MDGKKDNYFLMLIFIHDFNFIFKLLV